MTAGGLVHDIKLWGVFSSYNQLKSSIISIKQCRKHWSTTIKKGCLSANELQSGQMSLTESDN